MSIEIQIRQNIWKWLVFNLTIVTLPNYIVTGKRLISIISHINTCKSKAKKKSDKTMTIKSVGKTGKIHIDSVYRQTLGSLWSLSKPWFATRWVDKWKDGSTIWGPWTNMLTWVTISKVLCSGVFIYIKLLLRLFLKGTRIKNFDNVKNQITIIALV